MDGTPCRPLRNDIYERVQALREFYARKRAECKTSIEVGDLVVLRLHQHEHAKRTLSAHKLEAKWSVPYRVIGVRSNQTRIRVQSLLSWDQRRFALSCHSTTFYNPKSGASS